MSYMSQPPVGRRERKKAATRQSLEDHAFRLFNANGYDATTVEDISDAADVSARTFFRYYPTKEQVLYADHEPRLEAATQLLASRPADEAPVDSIYKFLHLLANEALSNTDRMLLQVHVAIENPTVLGTFRQQESEMQAALARFLRERLKAQDPNGFRARVVASAAMGTFIAASAYWVSHGLSGDLHHLVDEAFETLDTAMRTVQPSAS